MRGDSRDSGVVYDYIDGAALVDGRIDQSLDLIALGDVGLHVERGATLLFNLAPSSLAALPISLGQHDASAFPPPVTTATLPSSFIQYLAGSPVGFCPWQLPHAPLSSLILATPHFRSNDPLTL